MGIVVAQVCAPRATFSDNWPLPWEHQQYPCGAPTVCLGASGALLRIGLGCFGRLLGGAVGLCRLSGSRERDWDVSGGLSHGTSAGSPDLLLNNQTDNPRIPTSCHYTNSQAKTYGLTRHAVRTCSAVADIKSKFRLGWRPLTWRLIRCRSPSRRSFMCA